MSVYHITIKQILIKGEFVLSFFSDTQTVSLRGHCKVPLKSQRHIEWNEPTTQHSPLWLLYRVLHISRGESLKPIHSENHTSSELQELIESELIIHFENKRFKVHIDTDEFDRLTLFISEIGREGLSKLTVNSDQSKMTLKHLGMSIEAHFSNG